MTTHGSSWETFANYTIALLDVEQAWTSVFYLKSFDMDSVQVGKAVFKSSGRQGGAIVETFSLVCSKEMVSAQKKTTNNRRRELAAILESIEIIL